MLYCGWIQELKVVVDTAREDPTVRQYLHLHHFLAWMEGCPANENGVVGLSLKILNEVDVRHLDRVDTEFAELELQLLCCDLM